MLMHQWARHPDSIEDARDAQDRELVRQAVIWAIRQDRQETRELLPALEDAFFTGGHCRSNSLNNAIEIVMDAYLEEHPEVA
ncbi:hypothetical protein [Halomonas sp. NO4]|uniref:hypothetical protein n=1 Tax=Halomonas sp. NO4 TaxID=2484813 RepID=UPI0013D39B7E|nr:hypothetical protein [Halomonas sp. NO4]